MEDHSKKSQSPTKFVTTTTSSKFRDMRDSEVEYVDKSGLLKVLFDSSAEAFFGALEKDKFHSPMLITAPSCFGKSVNMDMVHCFVNIQIDKKTGKPIPKTSKDSNYKLFEDLEVMNNKDFVDRCFGTHPIIKLNFFFNSPETLNVESARRFCTEVIDMAYEEHKYLTKFTGEEKLDDNAIEWFYLKKVEKPGYLRRSVTNLAECLHKYHGKRTLILVDEYESLLYEAYTTASDADLKTISRMVSGIVGDAVRYNTENVFGVIMTGVSRIAGVGLSNMIRVLPDKICRFLDNGPMSQLENYYGLTLQEVTSLFQKYEWSDGEIKIAKDAYNGICSKNGKSQYNVLSIILHLKLIQQY